MKSVQKLFWIIFSLLIVTSTAWSQDIGRVEISFSYGWTFSDGVSGETTVLAPDGNFYDRVDPKDSSSWGFAGEYFVTPNIEVGFMFNRQKSTLELGGSTTREIGDLNVDNYDGTFSYNLGSVESHSRPFFMLGLGATHYGAVDFTFNGVPRSIDGNTKASVTFGGGLKFYASRNFGVRLQARLTPTYINTDEDGWWCDPFWGCYTVGNVQYSNQIEMSGGINLRF
jgi:Outer membrane protein beta-barrel domain